MENKVVSSFGKRKYTKGYYFNSGEHNKLELPVMAASKVFEETNQTNIDKKKEKCALEDTLILPSRIANISQQKVNVLQPLQVIMSNRQNVLLKSNIENIPQYSKWVVDYGIPGHGEATETENSAYFDRDARIGFTLGVLAAICALIGLIPFLLYEEIGFLFLSFLGCLFFGLVGLIFIIPGLRSTKFQTKAVIGQLLIVAALLSIIIAIIA